MKKNSNKLSIVIPTFNEKQNIALLIKKIFNYLKNSQYEIVVIDDNSFDGTKHVLKKIKKKKKNFSFYIRKKKQRDLSQSLILGIKKSRYENVLIMDGDLQHNPKYLPKIIKIYIKKKLDFLICVRNFKKKSGLSYIRYFSSLLIITLINIIFGKKISDPMSGFFIFKKEIYNKNKKFFFGKGFKILADFLINSKQNLK